MNVVRDIRDINNQDGYGVVNHNYVDSFNYGIEIILENNQIKLVKQDQEKYLPSDNKMTPEEQDQIIEIIKSCFE